MIAAQSGNALSSLNSKVPLKAADPMGDEESGRLLSKDSLSKEQLHKEQLQLESRATICGLPVQVVAGLCYCAGEQPTIFLQAGPNILTGALRPPTSGLSCGALQALWVAG